MQNNGESEPTVIISSFFNLISESKDQNSKIKNMSVKTLFFIIEKNNSSTH